MKLTRLRLFDFRNYETLDLTLDPGVNLILGENAYGITEVTGGGLKTIIKQLGSAGTADPLDQRSTVGWKAMQTAEILQEPYMVRVESCGEFSGTAKAN